MRILLACLLLMSAACPVTPPATDAGMDAGVTVTDAGPPDAFAATDAGTPDAFVAPDASTPDAFVAPDAGTLETNCSNQLDDDQDGNADCRDVDCEISPSCVTEDTDPACSDGTDNDGDSYVDCGDFDCAGHAACGSAERDLAACRDLLDNDGDTYVDCADYGCRNLPICSRTEDSATTCLDGVDNDSDSYTDCVDFGCTGLPVCSATEADALTCGDGVDNDEDGMRDCADTDCSLLPLCVGSTLRVVSWNVQQLTGGDAPSAQGQAAVDAVSTMLRRMNPDVACLNEIHDEEADALTTAATALGYPYVFQSLISTPMAGGLTNVCISRRAFVSARSRSSNDISADTQANETGRDFAEVTVELTPGGTRVTLFSAHLKSGFDDATLLRRHVESLRAAQVVTAAAQQGGVLFMGDLNEEITRTPGPTFTQPPTGMPFSYRLGSDLAYPFTYDPFGVLLGAGLTAANARHEDSNNDATRIPSGRRIDYILTRGVTVLAAEVYDPCRDNGVDDAPVGGRMEKSGSPVMCGVAEAASDHWPVMVDISD